MIGKRNAIVVESWISPYLDKASGGHFPEAAALPASASSPPALEGEKYQKLTSSLSDSQPQLITRTNRQDG